jgi:RHS repeat-associated protein
MAGRFGYTGQMRLPDIGLMHYKARVYSPRYGRFLQNDPIGYAGGLNLYAYGENDPINLRDPSGLKSDDITVIGQRTENPFRDPVNYYSFLAGTLPPGSRISYSNGTPGPPSSGGGGAAGAEPVEEIVVTAKKKCPTGGTKPLTSFEKFNSIAIGILDGLSFGLYSENVLTDESLARLKNDDAGYEAGYTASVGIGLGRVFYASAAKGISLFSSSAEAAVKNRNTLKGLMSGLGSAHPRIKTYDELFAKYGSDQAVRAAAGRTDAPINALGAVAAGTGISNPMLCRAQ